MKDVLVSVVIPTFGRPTFLQQAIESALDDLGNDVEVIVVPNGPDRSWKAAADLFLNDPRVRFAPIEVAHANAARNHGLSISNGTYLRFLDDDDELTPGATRLQCESMERRKADICSGAIELVHEDNVVFRRWPQPRTDDFVASVLAPDRVTAINAHVFRRTTLANLKWDETIGLGQDTHWMQSLIRMQDWTWVRIDDVVGRWMHHRGPRTSASSRLATHMKVSAEFQLRSIEALAQQGRLHAARKQAAAAGMWKYIHAGFHFDPLYWTSVLMTTRRLFPNTFPAVGLYRSVFGRLIHPLVLELLMLPKRRANHWLRARRFRSGRHNAVVPP
jgi:hypothetical protein